MSMLDMNVEEVEDLIVMPPEQYELKIANAEIKTYKGKDGKPDGSFLSLMFVFEDEENAAPVFHNLFLLNGSEDKQQKAGVQRRFKTFFQAFDLPLSGNFEMSEIKGQTGWATVKVVPASDDFPEKNEIGRFIVPN